MKYYNLHEDKQLNYKMSQQFDRRIIKKTING